MTSSESRAQTQNLHFNVSGRRFAVVAARWNDEVVDRLIEGALAGLLSQGVERSDIELFRCPGSYEIPLVVQSCAESKRFDGVIALGCVIRGETYHFELVSDAVSEGLMRIMLDTHIPCILGVLTTNTVEQAMSRAAEGSDNKGHEAALAAVEMVHVLHAVRSPNA